MTDEDLKPRPAVGHMPFKGHRTVAQVWYQHAAKERCNSPQHRQKMRDAHRASKAAQYGMDNR